MPKRRRQEGTSLIPSNFPTIPPRVDYALTKLGHSLLEPVSSLGLWARQNRTAIHDARRRFDAAREWSR